MCSTIAYGVAVLNSVLPQDSQTQRGSMQFAAAAYRLACIKKFAPRGLRTANTWAYVSDSPGGMCGRVNTPQHFNPAGSPVAMDQNY